MFWLHIEWRANIPGRIEGIYECDQETSWFNQCVHLPSPFNARGRWDGNEEPAEIYVINVSQDDALGDADV